MAIRFHEKTKEFHIFNGEVSYLMRIMENGQLENLYYGKAVRDKEDFSYLHEEAMRSQMSVCIPEPGILSMQYTRPVSYTHLPGASLLFPDKAGRYGTAGKSQCRL